MLKNRFGPLIKSFLLHGLAVATVAIVFHQRSLIISKEAPIPLESFSGSQKPALMSKVLPMTKSITESTSSQVTPSSVDTEKGSVNPNELQTYLAMLVTRINETKSYPSDAKRHDEEGEVLLRIEIAPSGQVLQVEIEKSAQVKSLDESALQAIRNLGQLPKLPAKQNGQAMDHSLVLHIPVEFRLR